MSELMQLVGRTPLVNLKRFVSDEGIDVYAKLELLNPGGSIKDRPAMYMLNQALQRGDINKNTHIVESSSGNLAIALAMFCNLYGFKFTAVVDPNISPANLKVIRLYGADVVQVTQKDANNGYLQTRIDTVKSLIKSLPNSYWINQYANPDNWKSHYFGEAEEILKQLKQPVDYLVISASTTGTLLGVSKRLKESYQKMKVIAVDLKGSVLFGGEPGPRSVPGIGASRVPELCDPSIIDDVIYVDDYEAAMGCHELIQKESIFAGGSSGANIAAINKLIKKIKTPSKLLTLFPDRGDRYLDSIYDDAWLSEMKARHDSIALQKQKIA